MRRVIGLGILLVGMSVTAEGVMEVEEPVTVVDGDHRNVVFTVPDATSWSWKLLVTAGSGWRHIDGTQDPSYGDWVPHAFSGNPGYWKSATVDDNSPWRNFQQPFHGKLSPVGEGPGEAYIGEYDIDAVTDSEYFVLPTINYVCAGKEVTLTAYSEPVLDPDNPPPTVNSTWEINKTDGITPNPFPVGHSVTFTASEPDEYTVKGESTSDTELTDSAQVNVIKVELEAKDTSTTAEGTRKSDSTLVMVKEGTTARGATMTLSVDGGSLPSGYPTWSGTDITGSAGSLTATYSGTSDSTGTADTGVSGCDQTVSFEIVDENKYANNWDFDQGQLKVIQDNLKAAIDAISGGDLDLSVTGSLGVEFKRVDMYNDGNTYGYFADITGTIDANFPDVSLSSPDLYVLPGVYVKVVGGFSASKVSLTGSTSYDQSKASPGTVGGSLTGSTTASLEAAAGAGTSDILSFEIAVTGSTTLSASGGIALTGQDIKATGTIAASDFEANATGDLKTIIGNVQVFDVTHEFDCDVSKTISTTLYTFN